MRFTRFAALATCGVLLAPVGSSTADDGRVDDFRVKMEKWVETRRLISEERADWDVERETLAQTRRLLTQQKEALTAEVAELQTAGDEADDERRELALAQGRHQRANLSLEERLVAMEASVVELAERFPAPLRKKLDPLLVQIPEPGQGEAAQLGPRLMNVLGILAQAEKWNGTATFAGETRSVDGGPRMQVRTLYWGLGQAVYVDARGDKAGVGRPAAAGWEFEDDPAVRAAAERLLDIYEGHTDAIEFVALPVEIR